jgi:hypothetical protein
MRKNIFIAFTFICALCAVAGCTKKNEVVEKKFASMSLSAFTMDTYRFRVSLTNDVVTDSLMTPEGQVAKEIFFNDYRQRIKVYNTSDDKLLIDTPYTLSVGKVNVFTIYQTQSGEAPFYLAPSPAEPLPATGNAKLSIICSGVFPSDSIKVIVTDPQDKPVDSVRLKKDNFSRYFELVTTKSSKVKVYSIPGNAYLGERVFQLNVLTKDGFSIYRLLYNGTSSLAPQKLF